MCHRLMPLISMVLLLGLAGPVLAGNNFTGNGDGSSWDDPNNWGAGLVPFDTTTHPASTTPQWYNDATWTIDGTTCVIDETMAAACYTLQVGAYGGDNTLLMTGGTLDIGTWGFNIGRGGNGDNGHVGSSGHVRMSGGVINTEWTTIPTQWGTSPVIQGELIMEGGTLNTGWMNLGGTEVGIGTVKLSGGVINVIDCDGDTPFVISNANCSMDVAGGSLIVCGDHVALIEEYIGNGWIIAHGGIGDFELDFNVRNPGATTLTALLSSDRAQQPTPGMLAEGIYPNFVLSWRPGAEVQASAGHDLYFGTSYEEVNDADPMNHLNVLYANVDSNSYGPVDLELNKTYYWRVDQINDSHPDKMWRGHVWQFTATEYLTVDDFESYGSTPLSGPWTAGGGVTAWVDTSNVNSGVHAMRLVYSDIAPAVVSRALVDEDWIQYGIQALNIRCKADAGVQAVSVALNHGTEQVIEDVGLSSDWQDLEFDISQFAIDAASVNHISIQIVPVQGASGVVIIDDIRLYPCRPGGLVGDLNGDCVVNFKDFAMFSDSWMDAKYWP